MRRPDRRNLAATDGGAASSGESGAGAGAKRRVRSARRNRAGLDHALADEEAALAASARSRKTICCAFQPPRPAPPRRSNDRPHCHTVERRVRRNRIHDDARLGTATRARGLDGGYSASGTQRCVVRTTIGIVHRRQPSWTPSASRPAAGTTTKRRAAPDRVPGRPHRRDGSPRPAR